MCLVWCSECCMQMSFYMLCQLVMYVRVCDTKVFIASRLSELRACIVPVLCSVIYATVFELRSIKLPVFYSSGRVLQHPNNICICCMHVYICCLARDHICIYIHAYIYKRIKKLIYNYIKPLGIIFLLNYTY